MKRRTHNSLPTLILTWHLIHHIKAAINYVDVSTLPSPLGTNFAATSGLTVSSLNSAGDLNGDGFQDLLIGASPSGAYVVFGTATGIPQYNLNAMVTPTQGIKIYGAPASTQLGFAVDVLGDVNGDDLDDIVVSGYGDNVVYVIFGNNETLTDVDVSNLGAHQGIKLTGTTGSNFGYSVCGVGDINDDGVNDILIGAPKAIDITGLNHGLAYGIFGNKNGLSSINVGSLAADQGFNVSGIYPDIDQFGTSVASAGDVNKDGIMDFMVGDPNTPEDYYYTPNGTHDGEFTWGGGLVAVFYGKAGISNINGYGMTLDQGFAIIGQDWFSPIGSRNTFGSGGDINGDGIDDLFLGIPTSSGSSGAPARAVIIYGKEGGILSSMVYTNELTSDQGFMILGDASSQFGYSFSFGDINGDNRKDLIVGAYTATTPNGPNGGKIYVFFGQQGNFPNLNLANVETEYPQTLQYYGASVQDFGSFLDADKDLNGDGMNDIITMSNSNNEVTILFGFNCDSAALGSSSLHPICYASKGCACGDSGKFIQQGTCVDECSEGYYLDDINCQPCPDGCANCTNANTCQSCHDTFLLQETSCVSTCSEGSYLEGIFCEPCPAECANCTNSNACQACQDTFLLQETSCVSTCSEGYYLEGIICKPCPNECANCTNGNTCQSCHDTFLLQETSCVSTCSADYHQSDATCIHNAATGGNQPGGGGGETEPSGNSSTEILSSQNNGGTLETIKAGSSNTGLIIGVVVGSVVLILGAIAAYAYRDLIFAKFTKARRTSKYTTSTSNLPAVQQTEGEDLYQNTTPESPHSPLSPLGPLGSPQSQTRLFFPQSTQTLQVLKVEVDP